MMIIVFDYYFVSMNKTNNWDFFFFKKLIGNSRLFQLSVMTASILFEEQIFLS